MKTVYILIASSIKNGNSTYYVGTVFENKQDAENQKKRLSKDDDIHTVWYVVEKDFCPNRDY